MSDNKRTKVVKDFSDLMNSPEFVDLEGIKKDIKLDPYEHLTKPTQNEIYRMQMKMSAIHFIGSAFLSFFTAPLTTSYASLQMSVLGHRRLYTAHTSKQEEALARISKEITPQQKRKYELMVKSGATEAQQPFRAAVYTNYREVFTGLAKQGFKAFYKGNLVGLSYQLLQNQIKFLVLMPFQFDNRSDNFVTNVALSSLIMTGVDIAIQPIHLIQSRLILQNCLPNYRTYKSISDIINRHVTRGYGEFFKGWQANIPLNMARAMNLFLIIDNKPLESFVAQFLSTNFMIYPLMTIKRRLECQTNVAGMIPQRYKGVTHGLKLIMKEEGFRGLYRGFFAFNMVQALSLILFTSTATSTLLY